MFKLLALILVINSTAHPAMVTFMGDASFKTQKECMADAKTRIPMVVKDLNKRFPGALDIKPEAVMCTDDQKVIDKLQKQSSPPAAEKPKGEKI